MNPAIRHVLQFFRFAHLPPNLQAISRPFARTAVAIAEGRSGPEATVALRKLLEAKDAAVRAALPPFDGSDAELIDELTPDRQDR